MRPWKRAVAVPLLLVLLASAGIAATWLHRPAPTTDRRRSLEPLLAPPLRHGGCDGRPWPSERTRLHPLSQATQAKTPH